MQAAAYLLFVVVYFQIASFGVSQLSLEDRCTGTEGKDGVCKLVRDCRGIQEIIKKGLRPVPCGFQGREPIVCCTSPESQPITARVPGKTAGEKCFEYTRVCTPTPRPIAGGVPADHAEFPHMAAIGFGDETDIQWNCGGTLISENFILTAAHCMRSGKIGPARWVLLGTNRLINSTATDGESGQIHPITRRISHPDYKPPAKYNDIALLEIGPAVTPNPLRLDNPDIHPACLGESEPRPGETLIATGWGRVGPFDDGSSDLLKTDLSVFNRSFCQQTYEIEARSSLLKDGIVPTMLCAGVLKGKRDTCQGDSGGPLQFPRLRKCIYNVYGVTSFGKVCSFPNSPSVYSRVDQYLSWIEDIVWPA